MIRRKEVDSLSGMKIYIKDFKTVIELDVNIQIDRDDNDAIPFESFLKRLASGTYTPSPHQSIFGFQMLPSEDAIFFGRCWKNIVPPLFLLGIYSLNIS
jgi:hypothetical protein